MEKICSFEGCEKRVDANKLCSGHNSQRYHGKPLTPIVPPHLRPKKLCSFEGCGRTHSGLGLCQTHGKMQREGKPLVPIKKKSLAPYPCGYEFCERKGSMGGLCTYHFRQQKRGEALAPIPPKLGIEERFWSKVDKDPNHPKGCWEWSAGRYVAGYGKFSAEGKRTAVAHKWGYERYVAKVPEGLYVDHICRNTPCVRLDHLRLVTVAENSQNSDATSAVSGYRNVHRIINSQGEVRWAVNLTYLGKRYYGGTHRELDNAVEAAVELRNKIYTHNEMDKD